MLASPHQPQRVPVRQGPQKDRINHAEDRCVGADPERQSKHRHRREAGRLAQQAGSEAHVFEEDFERARPKCFATFFLELFVPAKFDPCPPFRFCARQPAPLQIVCAIPHVYPQLFVQIAFALRATKQHGNDRTDRQEGFHVPSVWSRSYSHRSAIMGSTLVARRAGR